MSTVRQTAALGQINSSTPDWPHGQSAKLEHSMPNLDSCISNLYEPGFIPADPGQTPSVPILAGPAPNFAGQGFLRISTLQRNQAMARPAGAGSLEVDVHETRQQIRASFDGAGTFSARITQQRNRAAATVGGSGSLSVNATKVPP